MRCGNWARKIRIASAFTKPAITRRGTNRISLADAEQAERDLDHAGEDRRREQVLEPWSLHQRRR